MPTNDYFVIAYRILTYLYNCFMAGEKPDTEMFGPEALRINNGYWVNTMESFSNEGYITGIVFTEPLDGVRNAKIIDLKITEKGITFLHENSLIAKAKRTLKDVKNIIPGV